MIINILSTINKFTRIPMLPSVRRDLNKFCRIIYFYPYHHLTKSKYIIDLFVYQTYDRSFFIRQSGQTGQAAKCEEGSLIKGPVHSHHIFFQYIKYQEKTIESHEFFNSFSNNIIITTKCHRHEVWRSKIVKTSH